MDDVLRLGGNTEELRMRVAAEFEKRRSIDEIAAFLPTVYRGGNGFTIDGEKYAVWYAEDGIRVAHGEQARYERGAQLITWADAAARIGELLGDGRFATKEEVTGAEDYEHELIARKLRDLQHDLSKGNEGLFPSLADVDGGYPEAVQKIAAKLADPEGREAVLGDYLAFREAYKADRGVLRFHSHDVDGIFVLLAAQLLERRKFKSDIERVPEGTGYRARTRFSKFFNLPELMNLFREVADIKTSDQLMLPTPGVEYHNEVSQPTEIQKKLVQELSERATKVHARMVDPSEDNMLAITNDGRKLGLDQRVVNPLLPDAGGTKVNRCVDNVFRIWQDGANKKLTQLIFCDLSTPGKGFNIYDDIKTKLISRGVPESEIAFIHMADTEAKKKELFAKVRSGNVRVLIGSTAKMGAGTNVQDRLVALHDLDAPWRPGDLEQRKGRIARQGNMNETVHVYRYVTEQTFDSYIWQTLENKQRFISQIMTSKSPVRSCEDADETTLSYAEVKALCAGDPRIREKMDLDVQVAKLRLLKSSHQSQKYQLEDRLMQYFPREIAATRVAILGCEADIATRDGHPAPADSFAGIELQGLHYDERVAAGEALMQILPTIMDTEPVHIGSFRGFDVEVSLEQFGKHVLTLKGALEYHVELGEDARGNVTRIENALTALDKKLGAFHAHLSDLERQVENAREELEKPFPQEDELREKSARLVELNAELDMENNSEPPEAEKPSVLAKLKEPIPLYEPKTAPSKEACR